MADRQEDVLWQKLKEVPTLFQLEIPRMAERHICKIITKLQSEKNQVPEEFEEDVRSENLLAFLLLYIDKIEEARPHIESALRRTDINPNLIALGNACAYHLKQYNVSEAKDYLHTMDNIMKKDNQSEKDKVTVAIGEQAYCLSRLGPKFHLMAVDKFRKALSREPPNHQLEIMWNYGLALCLNRYLDRENFVEDIDFKPVELYEEAKHCLGLVTQSNLQAFCGKGWVVLGEVHYKFLKIHSKYFEDNRKPEGMNSLQIDKCFQEGLAVAPNDHFVLERAGRHHRHRKRIDDAIECLEKANEVRPSPLSWHHLGLAYRSKVPRRRTSLEVSAGRGGRGPGSGQVHRIVEGPQNLQAEGFDTPANIPVTTGVDTTIPLKACSNLYVQANKSPTSDDMDKVQRDLDHMTISSRDKPEPKAAQPQPHDDILNKAKQCLENAYALCEGTGTFIPTSLAEIYMQMGDHDKALQCFRKAIDKDNIFTSLQAAYCYQQWGECFLQMGQEENGKNMLRKAVESAARVNVEKKGAFSTLVTLMQRDLQRDDKRAGDINELARLYELVKRYRVALGFRETALALNYEDPTTLQGLVDNLRAQGKYAQARMYLSILLGLTDVEVPMKTIIEVNIRAAECQAIQDPNLARDIFLETFDFVFPTESRPSITHNVFVYSDEVDRKTADDVTTLCEGQFDLSCRCVHRDIPCTESIVHMVADLANKSACIILVVSETSLQKRMTTYTIGLMVKVINERDFGNLVTVKVDDCDLPSTVSMYPSIKMVDCLPPQSGVNTNLFMKMISTETSTSH